VLELQSLQLRTREPQHLRFGLAFSGRPERRDQCVPRVRCRRRTLIPVVGLRSPILQSPAGHAPLGRCLAGFMRFLLNSHTPSEPVRLSHSGFKGWPRVILDRRLAPVSWVWWATTPQGRQSKHLVWFTIERLRATGRLASGEAGAVQQHLVPTSWRDRSLREMYQHLKAREASLLPTLRPGYQWHGPFLFEEVPCPSHHEHAVTDLRDDALSLSHLATAAPKLQLAEQIATLVLSRRSTAG
jgi:hypothetical protein